jgi:hypothetical protein
MDTEVDNLAEAYERHRNHSEPEWIRENCCDKSRSGQAVPAVVSVNPIGDRTAAVVLVRDIPQQYCNMPAELPTQSRSG